MVQEKRREVCLAQNIPCASRPLLRRAGMVEGEEICQNFLIDFGAPRGQRMVGGQQLAGAGVEPEGKKAMREA
jgi:hypothetical protein